VDEQDPPGPATVVRGVLGTALAVAAALLLIELVAERSLNWELLALGLALWGAWSFFGSLSGALLPLGRIFGSALTGGEMPPGTRITIEQETATLERLVGAVPPPSPHRLIIAGIRLAEIYRTHQKDAAKADALIARLAAEHPDAPELKYVRSISG